MVASGTEAGFSTARAADGRVLAYATFGDPDGVPALYFHGTSTCRLDGLFLDAAAKQSGVHLIAVDRPGSGRSDPHPGRRLVDWPADVDAVADAVRVERYVVMGMSGGGPHTLACAATNPQRVIAAAPINTATPNDPAWLKTAPPPMRMTPFFLRNVPPVGRAMLRAMGKGSGREKMSTRAMPRDWKEVFSREGILETFTTARDEGLRQDRTVWITEGTLFWDPDGWGFDPMGLQVPVVGFSGVLDPSGAFTRRVVETAAEGSRFVELPGGHVHPLLPEVAATVVQAIADAAN